MAEMVNGFLHPMGRDAKKRILFNAWKSETIPPPLVASSSDEAQSDEASSSDDSEGSMNIADKIREQD